MSSLRDKPPVELVSEVAGANVKGKKRDAREVKILLVDDNRTTWSRLRRRWKR